MSEIFIRDALGERRLTSSDFPVALGGPGSAITLNGQSAGAVAYLGDAPKATKAWSSATF